MAFDVCGFNRLRRGALRFRAERTPPDPFEKSVLVAAGSIRLLWRRRSEDLALGWFRFRLRLGSLLGFFSALIFVPHGRNYDTEAVR